MSKILLCAAAVAGLKACGGGTSGSYTEPVGKSDGTVTEWVQLDPLPHGIANHCTTVVGDALVVVGGNYKPAGSDEFVTSDEIHVAAIKGDGSLGPWKLAGETPSPVSECNAVGSGKTLILIDGIFEDSSDGGRLWSADLSGSTLGPWTSPGDLGGRRVLSSEAWIHGASILLAESELPDEGDATVMLHAPLASPATWTRETWIPEFLGQAQYAFAGDYVYTLGGYRGAAHQNETVTTVTGAPVDADGHLGASFTTTALPLATTFGEAIVVDRQIFVVGGRGAIFGAAGRRTVLSAEILENGQLSAWTERADLPVARTNHDVVLGRNHLFVIGGAENGPGEDTVFSARVRF